MVNEQVDKAKQDLNKEFGKENVAKVSSKIKIFGREMSPELVREMFTNGILVIFGLAVGWYLLRKYILGG